MSRNRESLYDKLLFVFFSAVAIAFLFSVFATVFVASEALRTWVQVSVFKHMLK